MAQNPERPRICFITTPSEILQRKSGGFGDPVDISPNVTEIADIGVVGIFGRHSREALTQLVAEAVYSRLDDYNGFVVTTQRNELQVVAPSLAFAFGPNLDKTIALTSSNIPASFVHSGARERLVRATMAAAVPFNEVVIAYEDLILRGTSFQIKNITPSSLISYQPYTEHGELAEITSIGIETRHLKKPTIGTINFLPKLESIAGVAVTPGTEPEFIEAINQQVAGIVLSVEGKLLPYEGRYSLIPVIDRLIRKGIPVLVATTIADSYIGESRYQGEVIAEEFGVVIARNMNRMVAKVKFAWVLSRVAEEIARGQTAQQDKIARVKEWMEAPYVGEFGTHRPFNAIQV